MTYALIKGGTVDGDLGWMADTTERVLAAGPGAQQSVLAHAVGHLVDSDTFARMQPLPLGGDYSALQNGTDPVPDLLRTDIVRVLERHPQVVSYRTRPGDHAPRRLSDLISQRQWQAHPVYRTIGAAVGNRYQLTALVRPGATSFDGWVFNRTTRDFSDAELGRLGRLQTGLVSLDTQIRLASRTGYAATAAAAGIGITVRERQVLELLSRGLTARAIAHALLISERTVRKHLERTYRKLGCRDRLQAVQLATSVGVLDPPPAGHAVSRQRSVEPPAASAASIRAS